jgi:vacuolar-type H+-ATPase subunit H
MARQKQPSRQQLDSLIPAIKTEEKRLDDLLAEARARAEAMVREAEQQAAARVETARDSLPAFLEAERESRRAAMERKAAQAAAEEEVRARALEKRARDSMEATADYIVSLVWPVEAKTGDSRPGHSKPGAQP